MEPRPPLSVVRTRFLPGCFAGLAEPTAIADVEGSLGIDEEADARIRAGALKICPEHRFFGIADSDWPTAFLVPESPAAAPDSRLRQWIVALTVALQRWSLRPVWRGRVLGVDADTLALAVPWHAEELFDSSLRIALGLIEQWSRPVPDETALRGLVGRFRAGLADEQRRGISGMAMRHVQAAVARDIPFALRDDGIRLGWGAGALDMAGNVSGRTGVIAALSAENKFATKLALAEAELPQAPGTVVADAAGAAALAAQLGWPVVVKPLSLTGGTGVVPGIRDSHTLREAFEAADRLSPGQVIVEKHVDGEDHRLLVVRGRLLAAARRTPGGVTGDGVHTVAQLVDLANTDPRRTHGVYAQMRKIVVDDAAAEYLAEQGLSSESVPAQGCWVPIRRTANITTGGSAEDLTAVVHPDNRSLAERAARVLALDIAGVDFLTTDITRSWREVGGAITEVNINPSPAIHWLADFGRDLNGEILDLLFEGRPARIPTAAVAGSGAVTAAEMLHRIWTVAGLRAGVCTSSLTRIGAEDITAGDLAGLRGTRILFGDPGVEAAVIELTADGVLREGHPCDRYDVVAVLACDDNRAGPVAEAASRARTAIVVDADDPQCLAVRSHAGTGRHILLTRDPRHPEVLKHCGQGGEAVWVAEHGGRTHIHLAVGDEVSPVLPVDDNREGAVAAAGLARALGVSLDLIGAGLSSFRRSEVSR